MAASVAAGAGEADASEDMARRLQEAVAVWPSCVAAGWQAL